MPRVRRASAPAVAGHVGLGGCRPGEGSASEAALEAWIACGAQGYALEERRVSDLLPRVVSHLLQQAPEARMEDLKEIFISSALAEPPLFLRLVRPREGRVHFLHFWKAFNEVAYTAGATPSEGLVAELETLRDEVLRRLEDAARGRVEGIPAVAGAEDGGASASTYSLPLEVLVDELHRAAVMSVHPLFWQRVAMPLAQRPGSQALAIEDLTHILLVWVREALVWEHNHRATLELGIGETAQRHAEGLPVRLHIYDVSQNSSIQTLNKVLAFEFSPLKLGGVFHAGVEVNGLEWSFNYSPNRNRPGVCCMKPKRHPNHHFRETVDCGFTALKADEVSRIISEMLEDYPGQDYHLLRRNCCHFADDFLRRMGLDGIPGWVHRLAALGANVETALQAAQTLKEAVSLGCGTCNCYEDGQGKRVRRLSHRSRVPSVIVEAYPDIAEGDESESDPELGIFGKFGLTDPDLGIFGKFNMAATPPSLPKTESRAEHEWNKTYKLHM